MSQNEMIIRYLKPFGRRLSRKKCYDLFGFMTLNSRIPEIKSMGFLIGNEMVTSKNGKRYKEYFFI